MYEDMPHPFLLLLSPLSGGGSLLHAGGLLLGGLDPIATLTMLLGTFFLGSLASFPPCAVPVGHQEHVWGLVFR